LANQWIPAEAEKYSDTTKAQVKGTMATLQCNGWSGVNSHYFLAFIITTSNHKVTELFRDNKVLIHLCDIYIHTVHIQPLIRKKYCGEIASYDA